ncbi:hypothetical protein F5Y08DRAFT_321123 [Xylaria arbuscula]|nr:hypothetical protein F5Y08DRAFT_321123 [Xylaria arbuscula]
MCQVQNHCGCIALCHRADLSDTHSITCPTMTLVSQIVRDAGKFTVYADEILSEIEMGRITLDSSQDTEGVHYDMELASMQDRIAALRREVTDILVSLDWRSWNIVRADADLCGKLQSLFGLDILDCHVLRVCRFHQVLSMY